MSAVQPIRPAVEPIAEHAPTFTLDRQVAKARREMGEARWRELCAKFDEPVGAGR